MQSALETGGMLLNVCTGNGKGRKEVDDDDDDDEEEEEPCGDEVIRDE